MQFKIKNIIIFALFGILITVVTILCLLLLLTGDLSKEKQEQFFQLSISIIIIISIVSLTVFILILIKIINNFMKPIKYSSKIMENISSGKGSLDTKVATNNNDEAGSFISAFNEFLDNVKTLINAVTLTSNQSALIGNKQSNMVEITLKAIENISSFINTMKNQSTLLVDNISSSSNSIENLTGNIRELIINISSQSKTVTETSDLINVIKNSIDDVAKIARNKKQVADNLGNITIIEEQRVEETNKIINDISKSIDDILEMIEIINNISDHSNLLSMNAAIEASQAGVYGKGFGVVADEIGKLADSTGEKAKDISVSLKTLIKNINHALDSSRESEKSFKNIRLEVTNVINAFDEISVTTNELFTGIKAITDSSNSLKEITYNIDNKSSMMLSKLNDINNTIANIRNSSNNCLSEIDRIQNKTYEINSAIVEIAHYTIDNNNNTIKLNEEACRFTHTSPDIISTNTATTKLMQFMLMNMQNIGKKIFFLYPPDTLNNDKMIIEIIKSGYEIYIIQDHINILKILKDYNNSALFINIDKILDEVQWEEYVQKILDNPKTREIKIGIISNIEDKEIKKKYLIKHNVSCGFIKLSDDHTDNLKILSSIFEANEIRGRRKYIRTVFGEDIKVRFEINADNTVYSGNILNLSIVGMKCLFSNNERFIINKKFENISIDLAGTVIYLNGEISMHHEGSNSYVIMFKNITDSEYYETLISFIINSLQSEMESEMKK